MKPRTWKKVLTVNRYTLHQSATEPEMYSVRWKKTPALYGQRIFAAPSIERAIRLAPQIAGLEASGPSRQEWPLDQAFAATLQAARRGASARTDWDTAVRQFVLWLVAVHPNVGHWHQLSRPLLREYQQSLAFVVPALAGNPGHHALSPNGIRMRLQPITQTDAYMAREHSCPRVADSLSVSRELSRPVAQVYLPDALSLLDYLRANAPEYEAPAALQALAGLRVQEVTRLSWSKIDTDHGLVEISGAVKTDWSVRVIPIPARVLQALARCVQGIGNATLVDLKPDASNLQPDWRSYSRPLTSWIRRWNAAVTWSAKDLRNVLPTWATGQNIMGPLWEQYLGHAPKGVTARHYVPRLAAPTQGERSELDRTMDLFREAVTTPLDRTIAAELATDNAKRPGGQTEALATK